MAIVRVGGGVRFVAAAACPSAVSTQLARYVRERCDDVLWPDAAERVHSLLAIGQISDAVALYFERTGERWDEESLELLSVENGAFSILDAERTTDA